MGKIYYKLLQKVKANIIAILGTLLGVAYAKLMAKSSSLKKED